MKLKTIIFSVSIVFMVLLAYVVQTYNYLSPDVGYLLHATNQILAGGKYGPDIFETNPPLILYLYFPIVLLEKITAMNIMTAVDLYVIFLALISLTICYFLLKKLIHYHNKILFYFLFYTLAFIMLFLPVFAFAQREHILIILMMPYLLSAAGALENKSVHPATAVFIGLLAGLGFALKPFFLVTPCLIELYFIIQYRRLFAWVRIESVVIISVMIGYLCSIFLWQPDYIHIILPLVFRYYFSGVALSWHTIFIFPNVLFSMAMLFSYLYYYKQDQCKSMGCIFALALLGMFIAFLIPKTPWYYHVLPAFSLALLLFSYMLGQTISLMMQQAASNYFLKKENVILIVSAVIVLLFPFSYCYKIIGMMREFQQTSLQSIAKYINTRPGQHSIACVGLGTRDCFPLVYDTHSQYAERFPSFWWYEGVRHLEMQKLPVAVVAKIEKDKRYLINIFVEDLNKYKARWIVIDAGHFKRLENNQFDVVRYFSENEKFRAAWQHYHYLTTIKFADIYERNA